MNKKIEIEIKLPLLNRDEVKQTLDKLAEYKYQDRQVDSYFTPAHRNFLETPDEVNEWLRLRDSGGKYSLNYKNWHPKGQVVKTHCNEYETELSSGEDAELILKALDFKHLVTVDKVRKVWMLGDVEIAVDSVENLGDYIELEYKGNVSSIEEARKRLFDILRQIEGKTGEQDFRGYPYLLLKKDGML